MDATLMCQVAALALVVLGAAPHGAQGHMSDKCASIVAGRTLFTRNRGAYAGYTENMWYWGATYDHGSVQTNVNMKIDTTNPGSGCHKYKDRRVTFRLGNTCGDGNVKAQIDEAATDGQMLTNTMSRMTRKNTDVPGPRPHCTTTTHSTNGGKWWHLFGSQFRLPGPGPNSAGTREHTAPGFRKHSKCWTISVCFQGFMCQQKWTRNEYTVCAGCPKGSYEDSNVVWVKNPTVNARQPEYCIKCPAGQYSDTEGAAVCTPCPAGKFGDESNVPERDSAAYCAQCPAGRFGSQPNSIDPQCEGSCLAGYYCPFNSGTLNILNTGGTDANNPLRVQAGRVGNAGAGDPGGSAECPAGYYCPAGTAATSEASGEKPKECGSGEQAGRQERYYCPAGSGSPTFIDAGFYAVGEGDSSRPTYTRTSQEPCNPAKYCPGGASSGASPGQQIDCPAGKYGATTELKTDQCSGDCSPGFYCPIGSDQEDERRCASDANRNTQANPERYYCPKGSAVPSEIAPNDYYTFCCQDTTWPGFPQLPCPDNLQEPCAGDQRHYQGPCPT